MLWRCADASFTHYLAPALDSAVGPNFHDLMASKEIRLIFDVQLYYLKMIESLSESNTDIK